MQQCVLEVKVDQDTPVLIAQDMSKMSSEDFKYMSLVYNSESLVFSIRDIQNKSDIGYGEINIQKLLDEMGVSQL